MKFLVIEGLDGAGKSTQVKYIKEFLTNRGKNHKYLHFPRMESKYFGKQIARFLRGEFGKLEDVDPYIVAMMYAGDRHHSKNEIQDWLDKKEIVIVDRYVYSNIGYQCAKLKTEAEKEDLKNWILSLEYDHYKIPKPDLTIFLDVPPSFTKQKLESSRSGKDRDYLGNNVDIHEENISFQADVRKVYFSLQDNNIDYKIIDCSDGNGNMLAPEKIFEKITAAMCEYDFLV